MASTKTSLILVDKNKLWLYSGVSGEISFLDVPITVMKDMEILNHDLFIKQFESFITVHTLDGSNVGVVLASSLLFVKEFSGIEDNKKEEAVKLYIENIPFNSVAHTKVHSNKVVKVIATNKDLITLLKNSLEKHSVKLLIALPAIVIPTLATSNGLDSKTALTVSEQLDSLKAYNLMDIPQTQAPIVNITEGATDKAHPKRLPLLLGTFGGLISLLVGVIVVSNSQPTVPPSRAAKTTKATAVPVNAVTNLSAVKLDLIRNEQSASVSAALKSALQNSGIIDIRELADSAVPPATTQITFSNAVTVTIQGQIINIIKTIDPTFSTKVVAGLSRDVEIRLR